MPTLEININSFNHFPNLPLPAGAPLGQGRSLQGPSNHDGGAQVAEGGEQGVNIPISEVEGAGKVNPEAPKSAEGEANPDSEDDDLRVVHQIFMDNVVWCCITHTVWECFICLGASFKVDSMKSSWRETLNVIIIWLM